MNKHIRQLEAEKVLRRKNAALGWSVKEEIPISRKKAILAGGYRIGDKDVKKRFGKTSGKRYYGHFSGYSKFFMPKQHHVERAEIRDHSNELSLLQREHKS